MDSTITQRSGRLPWNELCEDHDHDCSLGSGRKSLRQFEGSTYYGRFQYKPITLYERLASWIPYLVHALALPPNLQVK